MLTFGSKPILFESGGDVADFFRRNLPLEGMRAFCPPSALVSGAVDEWSIPNYCPRPPIGLNQLYWPTGASRWAIGLFLMAKTDIAALSARNTTYDLSFKGNDGTITCPMYLLESRPVSAASGERLELAVLVDDRYWWQYRASADEESPDTWAALFTSLKSATGASFTNPTISGNYLIPDAEKLSRRYSNAAMMLDAAAHSVGVRIVRRLSGTVEAITSGTSTSRLNSQIGKWTKLAGGVKGASPEPAAVVVTFPQFPEPGDDKGAVWAVQSSNTGNTVAGTEKVFHSTAKADVSAGGSTPSNLSNLGSLGSQIATDYLAWLGTDFDVAYHGVCNWLPTGFDDHMLISFGRECVNSLVVTGDNDKDNAIEGVAEAVYDYVKSTRVQSVPVNFGPEHQLSQDSSVDEDYKPYIEFELDEELEKCSPGATATLIAQNGKGYDNPNSTIWVKNRTDGTNPNNCYVFTGKPGDRGKATKGDDGDYGIDNIDGAIPSSGRGFAMIEGYVLGKMLKSDSGQGVTVTNTYGTDAISPNQTVGVTNPASINEVTGVFEAEAGAWCKASRDTNGQFRFDVVECPAEELTADDYTMANAASGAYGGGGMEDVDGLIDLLVLNARERLGVPWKDRLAARRHHRIERGKARGARRDGAARRAGQRYAQGMRNTFALNVATQVNIHQNIHAQYDNYWDNMAAIFDGVIQPPNMPPHLPW